MKKYLLLIISFIFAYYLLVSQQQYVQNTKHNLAYNTTNTYRASSEDEICIFCHTPHSATKVPLWNRNDPTQTQTYTLYTSSTKNATLTQPDGTSVLCLSCHDGTIALGSVASRSQSITFVSGYTTLPAGRSNLGINLANDHPVSFVYNSALSAADLQLKSPATISVPVKLDANSKMQCTSCHDPHSNANTKFLHVSNLASSLCGYCHVRTYWTNTTHRTSTATWTGSGTNPWLHTSFSPANVANNACENCHNPHNAGGAARLLNYSAEETNCMVCHSGTVASSTKNIQTQLNKTYKHNVAGYSGIHDPTEANIASTMHVECVDCHNPHATRVLSASAPNANGYIEGVKGVSTTGAAVSAITYQYELCYRCHADSQNKPSSPTTRQIAQNNVRLEFDPANPSYHPIETAGKNLNVPSLITPWTTSSKMYCTDCHASDGTGSPKGPHGSTIAQILVDQYNRVDNTSETSTLYALCYKCHSRTSILANNSFKEHSRHISGTKTPCNTCHDPHGISSSQGDGTKNSNLINFNTSNCFPAKSGKLYFEDLGLYTGRCYVKCHNHQHDPSSY